MLGLLFFIALTALSATSLNWKWQSDDSSIKYYRYQLDGEVDGEWTVVDGAATGVTLSSDTPVTKFYLQASYDGESWSESSVAEYKKKLRDIGCLTVSWTNDEGYSYFRYQRDEEKEDGWTVVDGSTLSVILPYHEGQNRYFVQSSYDSTIWSDSAVTTYNYEKEPVDIPLSLRFNLAPYSSATYIFVNGLKIDQARTLMGTVYGVSTSIELDWNITENFRLYPEVGYSLVVKARTEIPKQICVHHIKAGLGCDYIFKDGETREIYIGLLIGAVVDINNNDVSMPTAYLGLRGGFEKAFSDNLHLGFMSRVTAALNIADGDIKSLYTSLTLLIDPAGVYLRYKF